MLGIDIEKIIIYNWRTGWMDYNELPCQWRGANMFQKKIKIYSICYLLCNNKGRQNNINIKEGALPKIQSKKRIRN
jgi:hypothetical protein